MQNAKGARTEVSKAPRGLGVGRGNGRELCPLPRIFLDLYHKIAFISTFWALYFTIQLPDLCRESTYIRDRYV